MEKGEIRFRRRESENVNEDLKFVMPSRCVSTPQSLNRSIPCTYESNQFTGVRSASYIDGLPEPNLSSRTRTAVVGPNTIHGSREGPSHNYALASGRGDVRAYYSSDITRAYTSPPTPISRYDCGDPPPYYTHRRSTQPDDGIVFIARNF
uniref:Homeobox protein homothorax n=1 Tax=Elaeophora elaphi TaxID=1147741 RepID=A0A0R3S495_9BILA